MFFFFLLFLLSTVSAEYYRCLRHVDEEITPKIETFLEKTGEVFIPEVHRSQLLLALASLPVDIHPSRCLDLILAKSCSVLSDAPDVCDHDGCHLMSSGTKLLMSPHLKRLWHLYLIVYLPKFDIKFEFGLRYKTFEDSVSKVCHHNIKGEFGSLYKLGLNDRSILTDSDFDSSPGLTVPSSLLSAALVCKAVDLNNVSSIMALLSGQNFTSLDWVHLGHVSAVKNQGSCGSCYAFSSVSVIESRLSILHNTTFPQVLSLSEQQVVDCSVGNIYGNDGCNGGWMNSVFTYVRDSQGLSLSSSYPYKAVEGLCLKKIPRYGIVNNSVPFINVKQCADAAMEAAVRLGPVSVAIDASLDSFSYYSSGIYHDPACSLSNPDHAVVIVGFGVDPVSRLPYWLVRNSWSSSWGEQGYIRMLRGPGVNTCGILNYGSYPQLLM